MRMHQSLACLFLATAALGCGSDGDGSDDSSANTTKQEARERLAAAGDTPLSSDPCKDGGWYADGVCDAWCPDGDARDCQGDIVCAAIARPEDGQCDEADPCSRVQDPDCRGSDDDDAIVCAAYFMEADGVCDRDDPCAPLQDEDCRGGDDGVACIEIAYAENGKCEAAKGCEYTDPVDCGHDDSIVCPAIWSPADGECNPDDPCGPYTDEDCQKGTTKPADPGDDGLVCTAIYRPKDGKCPGDDPCDPDC